MSDAQHQKVLLRQFMYPEAGTHYMQTLKEKSKLNYFASRIRAALNRFATRTASNKESELWWWTGMRNELVTYLQD